MQQLIDSPRHPSAPEATGSAGYSVKPSGIHATLVDVAADGQSLAQAAEAARGCGDAAAGSFGTATAVAAAFKGFWSGRDDVGERIASLLFRKADAVSAAASAFVEADNEMTSTASAALAKLPAGYAPHPRGSYRALH